MERLVRDVLLIEPDFDNLLVHVQAHEDGSRTRVIERLHDGRYCLGIVSAYKNILAAEEADDFPGVDAHAEGHVGQDKLLFLGCLFLDFASFFNRHLEAAV